MLLEILVSILLFALASMAVFALQIRSLDATSEAQSRAIAINQANAYVARIASYQAPATTLISRFAGQGKSKESEDEGTGGEGQPTGGDDYMVFAAQLAASLPGALAPTVSINSRAWTAYDSKGAAYQIEVADVQITISWKEHNSEMVHNYKHFTTVGYQPRKN